MPVSQGGGSIEIMAKVLNELNLGTWKLYSHANSVTKYLEMKPGSQVGKLKCTSLDYAGGIIDTWRATKGYPMILDVHWKGTNLAQAVVLDTVRRRGSSGSDNICGENWRSTSDACWGTICDPLDGDVHLISLVRGKPGASTMPSYTPKRNKWSFNAWGKAAHDEIAKGALEGEVSDFLFCTKKS
jgi:hypothetical protein